VRRYVRTESIEQLALIAKDVRREIFRFKTSSGYGHLASCLSCVDILTSIYMDYESKFDINHDRIIFSKGHGSPAAYPILVGLGVIPESELEMYCKRDGILRLHADYTIPGCFFVGGSLGNGIGFAAGLALARPWQKFYAILGDAELYEGSVWESLMFINHHRLKNVIIVVDRNKHGILGNTEEMVRLEPLQDKFEAFGFQVTRLDGHDLNQLRSFFSQQTDEPRVLIADTVKGKGVSFMEDKYEYHTIIPKDPKAIELGMLELS
jgi:transketolase